MEKLLSFAEKDQLQRLSTLDLVLCNTYPYHPNPPLSIIIPSRQHPHGVVFTLHLSISSATAARARACCDRDAHGAAADMVQTTLGIPEAGCVVTLEFWPLYAISSVWETVVVQGQA